VSRQIARQVLDGQIWTDHRNVSNQPFVPGPDFASTRPYLDLTQRPGAVQGQMAGDDLISVEIEVKDAEVGSLV
jgi:hypothetical protein